jgi:hypothetical protein
MNAGFGNLRTLKETLLAPGLVAGVQFDARLLQIGLGVAAAFDQFCGRKFARAEGATDIFPADRMHFLLPRFPIESVTGAELKLSEADGWEEQELSTWVRTIDLANGIVFLPDEDAGPYYAQVRFTYTGGYWWDTKEPTEVGYPTATPAGATELPQDLKLAWLLQCKRTWDLQDKLGTGITKAGSDATFAAESMGSLKLIDEVQRMLMKYTREPVGI